MRIIPAPSTLTVLKWASASLRRRKKLAVAGTLVLGGLLLALALRRDESTGEGGAANRPAPATRRAAGDATLPVALDDDEPTLLFGGGGLGRPPSSDNEDPDHPPQLPRLSDRIDEDDDFAFGASGNDFLSGTGKRLGQPDRSAPAGGADAWRPSSRVGIWQQFDSTPGRIGASREWPADNLVGGPSTSHTADREPAGVPPGDLADEDIESADHEYPAATAGVAVHRIRDGDTLSGLARRYLGSRERYWEIYDANRDRLTDPDLLPIGVEIRIPIAAGVGKPSMLPVGRRVPHREH